MGGTVVRFPGPRRRNRVQSLLAEAYRFTADYPRFSYAGVDRAPGMTTLLFVDRQRTGGFSAHVRENGVAHALDERGAFLAGGRSLETVLDRVANG